MRTVVTARQSDVALAVSHAPELQAAVDRDPRLGPAYLWLRTPRPVLAPLAALVYDDAGGLDGVVYAAEELVRGIRVGLLRLGDACAANLLLARPGRAQEVLTAGVRALARLRRVHAFIVNRPTSDHDALDVALAALGPTHIRRGEYTAASVIALPGDLDQLLATLGPDSRRNLRRYPKHAARDGVRFVADMDAATFRGAFDAVRAHCGRWNGIDPNETVAAATHPLRAALVASDGTWLSVLAGWRHTERAFVGAQLNDGRHRDASLSAVLRLRLIEHLIADRARALVFLGGCAGTLRGACIEEPITRTLVELRTPRWRLAKWLAARLAPSLARRLWPPTIDIRGFD